MHEERENEKGKGRYTASRELAFEHSRFASGSVSRHCHYFAAFVHMLFAFMILGAIVLYVEKLVGWACARVVSYSQRRL